MNAQISKQILNKISISQKPQNKRENKQQKKENKTILVKKKIFFITKRFNIVIITNHKKIF